MIFQCMFAIITPALITGAFAERMKFSALILFTLLWATFVYNPLCHWVWAVGGWMGGLGALDFAGGTVVHISSGISALAAALLVGRRMGYGTTAFIPHNLPMTLTGAALCSGSDGSVSMPAAPWPPTDLPPALSWSPMWPRPRPPYPGSFLNGFTVASPPLFGVASGAVAGLVAITPASGFVGPMSSIIIGFMAGAFCYGGVLLKSAPRI